MDGSRFDALVRALDGRAPRRDALRVVVAAAFGGLTATLAVPADARRKDRKKKRCPEGHKRNKRTGTCECVRQTCTGGREFDAKSCRCRCPRGMRECNHGCVGSDQCCPGDPPCPEDPKGCCHAPGIDVCTIDGCCRELDGMKACNDFCVDTDSNPNHCGGCNRKCRSGERCVNGRCKKDDCPNCPAGHDCCNGKCVDIENDHENCGACGNACDTRTQACSDGTCQGICSLNEQYTVECDDGVDYWCCPERSPVCCKPYGSPHCC